MPREAPVRAIWWISVVARLLSRLQAAVFSGPHGFGSLLDEGKVLLQSRPMIGPQFQDGKTSAGKILLMAQVLVANDQQLETRFLSGSEESAVFESAPTHLHSGQNLVRSQGVAHLHRRAHIEEDFHSANSAATRSPP